MKKIPSLALVILLALSLSACGGDKTNTGDFTADSPEIIQVGKIGSEISIAYEEVMALAETNGWVEDSTFTEEANAIALANETCTQLVATPPNADAGVNMPGVIKDMEEMRDLLKGELRDKVSVPYVTAPEMA